MPKVCIVTDEFFADEKVYFVADEFFADERVYVVRDEIFADKKVYPVRDEFFADKKVYRVHDASLLGATETQEGVWTESDEWRRAEWLRLSGNPDPMLMRAAERERNREAERERRQEAEQQAAWSRQREVARDEPSHRTGSVWDAFADWVLLLDLRW